MITGDIKNKIDALLLTDPRNLQKIVDMISNTIDMNNRDTMGDVYEYVLGKMASSSTNGQFRTPRHIINLIVDLMQPTPDDTLCDVAMGTAILVFTKTNAGGTDKVWFYDMHADGYTLDQKRTPCEENDIPDIIQRFANLKDEGQRTRRDQSFLVPADEIRQNDYDLTFNKYKEVVREKVQYDAPDVILGRIDDLEKQIQEGQKALRALLSD
jgi:type I restriction-modification system DNA methylase subunit